MGVWWQKWKQGPVGDASLASEAPSLLSGLLDELYPWSSSEFVSPGIDTSGLKSF